MVTGSSTTDTKQAVDTTIKDVLLLAGNGRSPIFSNSVVLSNGSDYYKNALSELWTREVAVPPGLRIDPIAAKSIKAVLSHPDIDFALVKIVVTFIETGIVTVADDCLSQVACFADQLFLVSLVQQCLTHYAKHFVTCQTVFAFALLCNDLNQPKYLENVFQSASDLKWLKEAIQFGNAALAGMSVEDVQSICSHKQLSGIEQQWMIMIGWAKSRQGLTDTSVKGGLKKFDVVEACEDLKDLINEFEWGIKVPYSTYSTLMALYKDLFQPEVQQWLTENKDNFILLELVKKEVHRSKVEDMAEFNQIVSIPGFPTTHRNMIERNESGAIIEINGGYSNYVVKQENLGIIGDLHALKQM
ncbi:UNVERIFIED_CONTAM: hypothetical protein HDU68_002174 [Siphonaria sp. JEL0065]|nr:hypothetical protein HDU68_002174 [Siphonaria sp. JEL0065]